MVAKLNDDGHNVYGLAAARNWLAKLSGVMAPLDNSRQKMFLNGIALMEVMSVQR